jgi:hypothetical protein
MLTARPYAHRDKEGCLRVLDSNVPDFFLATDRDEVAQFLENLDLMGVRYFVVETAAREIVAYGGVAVNDARDARMCWGMVRRDRHREGLGRVLLLLRALVAVKLGARTASLATISRVAGFFERTGFEITGGEDDHYAPGMHRRDLRLKLDGPRLRTLFDSHADGLLDPAPGVLDE